MYECSPGHLPPAHGCHCHSRDAEPSAVSSKMFTGAEARPNVHCRMCNRRFDSTPVPVVVWMRNDPHRCMYLNTWSPGGGALWEIMETLGGTDPYWRKYVSRGSILRAYSLTPLSVLPASCDDEIKISQFPATTMPIPTCSHHTNLCLQQSRPPLPTALPFLSQWTIFQNFILK